MCSLSKRPAAFGEEPAVNPRRGAVLVLVLGTILVMSWLAVEIVDSVREELAVAASPAEEDRLRQTSYQLLELSMAVLAEIQQFEGGLYSPSQGWGVPLAYAGLTDTGELDTANSPRARGDATGSTDADEDWPEQTEREAGAPREEAEQEEPEADAEDLLEGLLADIEEEEGSEGFVRPVTRVQTGGDAGQSLGPEIAEIQLPAGIKARVRLYDETGKIPLVGTSEDRWLLFFEAMGFEETEGQQLTASLLDWMDADDEERENGAETDTYSQEEPPYRAPNRPLRDFRELRWVEGFRDLFFSEKGIPNEKWETFRRNVSLYHRGAINLNTASTLVLETLGEEKGFEVDNVLDFLAGSDLAFGTEDDRILRPGLDEDSLPTDEEGNPIVGNVPIRILTAEIAVSSGEAIYYLNALIDISQPHPGGTYPFRISHIVENQPLG